MGIKTNWEIKEMPAWKPESWLPYGDDQLIISSNRILASYQEMPKSGIGCRYILDLGTGRLLWKSKAAPIANAVALNNGFFLMGIQGYGAFETHLFDENKDEIMIWNSHGIDFVTDEGNIMSIQMSNDLSVPQHIVKLHSNGEITSHSEQLPGYHTSKPLLFSDRRVFFWRGDHLWLWKPNDGLKVETKIGLGEGSYATSHRFPKDKFALNIRHSYGNRLSERIWAVFDDS